MKFKESGYERRVEAILDELIEPEMIESVGDEGVARFALAMALGLMDDDVIRVDAETGYVILETPPEEIAVRLKAARAIKKAGRSLRQALNAGLFEEVDLS